MSTDLSVVERLSRYRPFERGGTSALQAQEDLVVAALAEREAGSGEDIAPTTVAECQDDVKVLFGLELDRVEVAHAFRSLLKGERIRSIEGGYRLEQKEAERLAKVASETEDIEVAAMDDWRAFVVENWPTISDHDLERLAGELPPFLQAVVRRHGAEAALLLYPGDNRAATMYVAIEEEGFGFLPAVGAELATIRQGSFSEFIRNPSAAQQAYLSLVLNCGYFLTVLTIDPAAAEAVREIATGQRVYFDTNFIYRLLGIQGPRFVLAA